MIIPQQKQLNLSVKIEQNVQGIEMGILDNGMAYLTQTGLANLLGISRSVVYDLSKEWESNFHDNILGADTRIATLKQKLFEKNFKEPKLYIEIQDSKDGHYAYPEVVCMVLLDYYAFDSKIGKNETALQNFRQLASYGLQKYIYTSLNYQPIDSWKYFQDRVSLLKQKDQIPNGYFIVFNEITGLIVDLINTGIVINHEIVPDISVGQIWAKYWKEHNFAHQYGESCKCKHNYPPYYPQAAANPQDIHAYPESALHEFRSWFKNIYLPTKFPAYILKKVKKQEIGQEQAAQINELIHINSNKTVG